MRHTQSPRLAPSKVLSLLSLQLIAGLLLTAAANSGEVFKWTDGAGKIHYGDRPSSGVQATRLEVQTSPETQTAPQQNAVTVHDGGYSDTLNSCRSNGGTTDECVAKASAAQTNKSMNERMLEEANRNRAQAASNQFHPELIQPTANSDAETARRAAALAAERARQQRERLDRDWGYR